MCGRYASARKRHDLLEEFEVELDSAEELEPDYNVAPTKEVYAVLSRVPKVEGATRPVRQLRVLRWGLVPSWAKDPSIGSKMINARVETVADKPAFRRAFASRRCLLPADGYYEWMPTEQKRKQPYFIHRADGDVLAMAGLYEFWKDPEDDWLVTCTVITTTAEDELGHIHDRTPMLIQRDRWSQWLDPRFPDPKELLVPATGRGLVATPVSTAVNNVRNNGPELIEAVEAPLDL
ncbi:SOS response-associated peptidase [Acrocarpospora catenulata]|uniref:SOS response-associated peptidase n=1 Tax=Acrocarpospora catenulata TaxID=2836182 RepID=UPI001BDA08B4|nr:SOS response-associated peptidase [Acrocarpospora catenulata]